MTYPGNYELPLRTMYALNTAPRGSIRPGTPPSSNGSNGSSPNTPQGAFPDTQTTQSFTENLLAQVQQLSNQTATLPPSFIVAFLNKCFPPELTHVDFPQALTGLDYLKDLETRRRREVAAAMNRLEVDREALDQDAAGLSSRYPGVLQWVKSIEEKERKIDSLYTQVFLGLRRWIIVNELSLLPFHKHNCLGMLNTLYPPIGLSDQPTSLLSHSVLKNQREGYFKYITSVEKNGPRVLSTLMQQGKAPGDDNGWISVTRTLSMYLQVASSIITECSQISNIHDVSPRKNRDSNQTSTSRHTRNADSGISFGSTSSISRPSTRGSTTEPTSPMEWNRPKTPNGARSGTTLEKIARGLRTMGRSRSDVTEIIMERSASPALQPMEKPKMLRKMRSLGSLGDRKGSMGNLRQAAEAPAFDVEAMRLHRKKYEATAQAGKRSSHEA